MASKIKYCHYLTSPVICLPLTRNEGDKMKKQTKQDKYLSGLESKGLVKTCVVVPLKNQDELRELAQKFREDHLGGK